MCLAIPGKIISIEENAQTRMGKVSYEGVIKEACLAYVPEAKVGDYVYVHVGFAISRLDEKEAAKVYEAFREMDALGREGIG